MPEFTPTAATGGRKKPHRYRQEERLVKECAPLIGYRPAEMDIV